MVDNVNRNYELRENIKKYTEEGYSQAEIARMTGVSRQRVHKLTQEQNGEKHSENILQRRLMRVRYKGIREYLFNNRMTVTELCCELGEQSNTNGAIPRFLYGITDKVSVYLIKNILDYTGLTFEEAFIN